MTVKRAFYDYRASLWGRSRHIEEEGYRYCRQCHNWCPEKDFSVPLPSWCSSCTNVYLLRNFGITLLVWRKILRAQKGRCAICRVPPKVGHGNRFVVDHDHETGQVRGIL